jgi:tRNA(Ile)-lysidine synthase
VTIDHGLQAGSAARASDLVDWGKNRGFVPSVARSVSVREHGDGPEAAARSARYAGLIAVAKEHGARTVLLGHTRDDQAETVLLALARGGGPRGLAAMPRLRMVDGVVFARPLLDITRAQTRTACAQAGLTPWDDPHNSDPRFARTRVRQAMSVLTDALGVDIVANLARSAALIAEDNAALDDMAWTASRALDPAAVPVQPLAAQPAALRRRLIRLWCKALGVRPAALSHRHIAAIDALLTDWHGQGAVALPGDIWVGRVSGRLVVVGRRPR